MAKSTMMAVARSDVDIRETASSIEVKKPSPGMEQAAAATNGSKTPAGNQAGRAADIIPARRRQTMTEDLDVRYQDSHVA